MNVLAHTNAHGHNCFDYCYFVYTVPIQGGWSSWSISQCSSDCYGGTRTYRRTCDHPTPQNTGEPCMGTSSYNESCGSLACGKNWMCLVAEW